MYSAVAPGTTHDQCRTSRAHKHTSRAHTLVRSVVDVGTIVQQQSRNGQIVMLDCHVQRRKTAFSGLIDVRPLVYQYVSN